MNLTHKLYTSSLGFVLCLVRLITSSASPNIDYEELALSSCMSGDYTTIFRGTCNTFFYGHLTTSYKAKNSGWLTVDIETVAMVAAVEIIFDNANDTGISKHIRLRVMLSDTSEFIKHVVFPKSSVGDFVRQRVLFLKPRLTKSVTITWSSKGTVAISEVSVIGTTHDVTYVNVTSFTPNACSSALDGNKETTCYLQWGDGLDLTLDRDPGASPLVLALYSAPLMPETTKVPLDIMDLGELGPTATLASISYTNQASNREVTWQTVTIETAHDALSIRVTRDIVTISEIEIYNVNLETEFEPVIASDIPHVIKAFGDFDIFNLSDAIIDDDYTIPPSQALMTSSVSALLSDIGEATTLGNDIGTKLTTDANDIGTSLKPTTHLFEGNYTKKFMSQIVNSTITSMATVQGTKYVTHTAPNGTESTETVWFDFWNLSWYWYVLIGTGGFILVLVIVIIVLLTRLRTKSYKPRRSRPRVVLRSLSSVGEGGDGFSMVTPTRGYYHLTMNSQSSMPLPYTAFSPVNTTTFSRKDAQQGMGAYNFDVIYKSTDSEKYNHGIHDGELSDDCFL